MHITCGLISVCSFWLSF